LESDERIILMEIHLLFSTILLSLCGSLPFSVWITRLIKGIDVRDSGSGHATTTNWNRRYQELWLDQNKSE
jgi:glycerol-3-phosphate acyltransferase PlsY